MTLASTIELTWWWFFNQYLCIDTDIRTQVNEKNKKKKIINKKVNKPLHVNPCVRPGCFRAGSIAWGRPKGCWGPGCRSRRAGARRCSRGRRRSRASSGRSCPASGPGCCLSSRPCKTCRAHDWSRHRPAAVNNLKIRNFLFVRFWQCRSRYMLFHRERRLFLCNSGLKITFQTRSR